MINKFELNLPEYKTAKIELWKYLTLNDVIALRSCFNKCAAASQLKSDLTEQDLYDHDYEAATIILSKSLNLNLNIKNDSILVDAFFHLVKFGIKNNFTNEQLSALIYMLKLVHDLNISTSFDNLEQTFDYLRQLLILFSVHRPPFSLELFNAIQAKFVYEYFAFTYFKQFKLYKLIFTPAIKLDLRFNYNFSLKSLNDDSSVNITRAQTSFDDDELLTSDSNLAKSVLDETSKDLNAIIEQQEVEEPPKIVEEEVQVKDENSEIKALIKRYFNHQISKMKLSLESVIKESENEINRKLAQLNTQAQQKSKRHHR